MIDGRRENEALVIVVNEVFLLLHLRLVQSRIVTRLVPLEESTLCHATTANHRQ